MCKLVTLDSIARGCKQVDSTVHTRCFRNKHADRRARPCIKLATGTLAVQLLAFLHDVFVRSSDTEATEHGIVCDFDAFRNNVTSEIFLADARVYAHMVDP